MSFVDLVRQILRTNSKSMTPQQIRESIKANYPEFYGTASHRRNVEKGHYRDVDHALLAQIYVVSRTAGQVVVEKHKYRSDYLCPLGKAAMSVSLTKKSTPKILRDGLLAPRLVTLRYQCH